jgi:DNA mismatch repair protein MutL
MQRARKRDKVAAIVTTIAVLPDELASQIAAGEVVERPASALKELLENAMDAGATRVGIEIEGGGITRLSVLDDGIGMSEADAVSSLKRHATSKLRSFSDLEQLSTYGFRGEALPSIASVSRLTVRTRRADSPSGVELTVEGGLTPSVRPTGCAPGTLVEVRDLFFNVPARRKFLRSSGTEAGHLTEIVECLALANPRLALTLKRDGRMVRQWLRVSERRERAAQALDEEFAECRGQRGPLGVEAYVTRPERARTGAGGLRILVNGRPIRDRALAVAVAQAYGSVLERGRYPRGVVYLELPPQLVDFNVHPQKVELRFADPRAVSDALYQVLASQLGRGFSSPSARRQGTGSALAGAVTEVPGAPFGAAPALDAATARLAGAGLEEPSEPRSSDGGGDGQSGGASAAAARSRLEPGVVAATPFDPLDRSTPERPTLESGLAGEAGAGRLESPRAAWSRAPMPSAARAQASAFADRLAEAAARSAETPFARSLDGRASEAERSANASGEHVEWAALEFIAQVQNMFLICESPAGLFIIDQHAAAERVTFDRIRRQYQARTVASQALLFPVEVPLSNEELEFLEQHLAEFAALGMDLRLRGTQWVSVHGVPRLLERVSPERLLRDLLAETMRQGGRDFSGAVDLALATLACHASLRSGDGVTAPEARALLGGLDGVDFAGHCPHGRPIVAFTPYTELMRKVGRR